MRVKIAAIVVTTAFLVSACGSTNRVQARRYSASQIKSVFLKHGVGLHTASSWGCTTGYVCLESADGNVSAYVFVGRGSGAIQYIVGNAQRQTDKANLAVVWDRQYRNKVRAALQSLR
jgi:hypothetical protein